MKEKLLNKVWNIIAKGEMAEYEQFLFLPQCLQESYAAELPKSIYRLEMVKQIAKIKMNAFHNNIYCFAQK